MKSLGALVALLTISVAVAAPTAPAVRLQGQIALDGVLNETAWQAAAWQSGFVSASSAVEGKNPLVAVQTRFKVLFDDDALYVGVECDEPNLDKLVARYTEHDQDVYGDDCVEVFFDPAGEGRYYHHFAVNTNGAWYDDTGADYGLVHAKLWEFPLQVGTKVDPAAKQWRAELRLSFAAMNLRDNVQPDWLFNIARERYAGASELSTWSPLKGNFHSPRLFGKLTGVNVDFRRFAWNIAEPQVTISGDGSGQHVLRLKTTITNNTPQARKVVLTAQPFLGKTPPVAAEATELSPGASATIELPPLTLAGNVREAVVQLNVLDAGTVVEPFAGIGAVLEPKADEQGVLIAAVLDGGPAAGAGLRPGDVIIKLDNGVIGGMTLTEVVKLIRGASGTPLTLTVKRKGVGNPIEVTVARAPLQLRPFAPLKIAVKHLDSEYRPITIRVKQPVYRNNIYATQDIKQLVFTVELAPDVLQKTATVVYSLRDAADKPVRDGKAKAAQLGAPQKLEVGALPFGMYTLTARALDAADKTIVETSTPIRKLIPATGSEVRIDEAGNIVVNGKPKVFIGWYGNVPLEDPRPEVIALQDIQTPVVLNGLDPAPVRESFAKGIYSVVSIEPGRMFYTFSWWRDNTIKLHEEISKQDAPSEEFLGYLKQLVNSVKDEPGLLGYYLADEPEINNARSAYMEAIYRVMQELDPYHPVMITNDTLDGIVTHGYRACDILNPDPYSPEPEYVPNFMKRCHEVMRPGQGIMMTPWHSAVQTHMTAAWGTDPPYPYRTMRMQYLEALAYGCRGFTGYTSAFFMPEIELRYGLPHIWREVRFLEPGLVNPLPSLRVTGDFEFLNWGGKAGANEFYWIVVNTKGGTRMITIDTLMPKLKTVFVVSEGRSITLTNGILKDTIAEGDAHIYTTNPAGAKLPTVTQVEKELADRKAADVKPGNLLHNSLGIRARASEGFYAPWFSQFYYYAMNGITDDLGWSLSHTDKPSWLEITLPQAKNIGRVVIYSPNLKDYDLQFQGPDGAVQVAEVRGSDQPVAEHTFQPAIPTLKLRITALALRTGPGTQNATVREIEAYEQPGPGAPTPVRTASAGAPPVTVVAPTTETQGQPVLWREDFANFQSAPKYNWDGKDDKWVLNAANVFVQPQQGGGLVFAANAAEGYAGMSHFFPYDPQYRYFQVSISKIEGEGYKWGTIAFGESSGKLPMRNAVHTLLPGIYTVDTHSVHESFRTGTFKQVFLSVFGAGSGKNAEGTVKVGPKFTYDFLQLVRRPTNGLIVTMADGSPVPPSIKQGDTLLYRVILDKPAQDVTVETQGGSNYSTVPINREPSVQLFKVGAGDGREWAAQVTLGPGTGKFEPKGYPVLFRAVVSGGAIPNTMVTMDVKFE